MKKSLIFISYVIWLVITCADIADGVTPLQIELLYIIGEYEQISDILGIDPDFIRPSTRNPIEHLLEKGLEQGDIILTPSQKLERQQNPMYSISPGKVWDTKEIPYAILESSYNSSEILNAVKAGIQSFNDKIKSVSFRPWKPTDDDCVLFYDGNPCYSNIGHIGGFQSISVGTSCNVAGLTGFVHHHMMHALSFIHESNRPDRDTYIQVNFENLPDELYPYLYKADQEKWSYINSYDYYSVLHIPPDFFNVKSAYTVLQDGIDKDMIGPQFGLSELDIDKIEKLYGKQNIDQISSEIQK